MTKGLRAVTILMAVVFTLAGAGRAAEQDRELDETFLLLMAARNAAKAKEYEQSVNRYQRLLEKDPGLTDARTELGWVLVRTGKPDEARTHFKTVLQSKPRDAEALKGLLESLKKSGQEDEVFKVLKELVAVLPDDRDLRMQLAVELHNRGRYTEAEEHLNILLQKDPRHDK